MGWTPNGVRAPIHWAVIRDGTTKAELQETLKTWKLKPFVIVTELKGRVQLGNL